MRRVGSRVSKVCLHAATCLAAACVPTPDESASSAQALVGDCSLTLAMTPDGRQPDGTAPVAVTSKGVCLDGSTPEFRTTITTPASRVIVACDWQTEPTCTWSAEGLGNGTFNVKVEARRPGDDVIAASSRAAYAVGAACTAAKLRATPEHPAPGERVTISAEAECDPGVTPEYAFSVTPPGAATINLGAAQLASTTVWSTSGIPAGPATLRLRVRPLGNRAWDVAATLPLALGDVCTAGAVSVRKRGAEHVVSATATCTGDVTPEYQFSVFAPDGTATLLRDFAPEPSTLWDARGLEGTHVVRSTVRAAENRSQLSSFRERSVVLADGCSKVTLSPIPASVAIGSELALRAEAGCSDAEFAFQVKASTAAAWATVCAYAENASCAWRAPEDLTPGSYMARALVRKSGSIAARDAISATLSFVVEVPIVSVIRLQDVVGERFVDRPPLLSGDGSTVVLSTTADEAELFVWTEGRGIEALPAGIFINDVSFDGAVLVGGGQLAGLRQAVRWTRAFGLEGLGTFPFALPFSQALSVSSDGARVVGESSTLLGVGAFEWTAATRFTELLSVVPDGGAIQAASADARVLLTRSANFSRWARWSEETGPRELAIPAGAVRVSPSGLTTDGRFAFGSASGGGRAVAVLWDDAGNAVDLTQVPTSVAAGPSFALAASAGASRVFGRVANDAFVWDAERGLRRLIEAYPLLLDALRAGELPVFVSDVSADGKVLIALAESADGTKSSYYRIVLP